MKYLFLTCVLFCSALAAQQPDEARAWAAYTSWKMQTLWWV